MLAQCWHGRPAGRGATPGAPVARTDPDVRTAAVGSLDVEPDVAGGRL